MWISIYCLARMSEGKRKHRLESKKGIEASSFQQLGEVVASPPILAEAEFIAECVEEHWNAPSPLLSNKGGRWLIGGLAALSLFFVVCFVWAALMLSRGSNQEQVAMASAVKEARIDPVTLRKQAVENYLIAESVVDKAAYVRSADRIAPLMRSHYHQFPLEIARNVRVKGESPLVVDGETLWQLYVEVDGEKVRLLVEMTNDGSAKVDWVLDSGYQPVDLDAFIRQRSTEPSEFRVFVQGAQLDGFHGFEFSDYHKFRCYKVTFPKRDEYLWAYTEIGSELDKKWFSFVTSGRSNSFDRSEPKPVIVELSYPENSQSERCVHLGALLKSGWLR